MPKEKTPGWIVKKKKKKTKYVPRIKSIVGSKIGLRLGMWVGGCVGVRMFDPGRSAKVDPATEV